MKKYLIARADQSYSTQVHNKEQTWYGKIPDLPAYYLKMEKCVVAQMSVNRLIREIHAKDHAFKSKSLQRSQQIKDMAGEMERLKCKRLKNKFNSQIHHNDIQSTSPSYSYTQHDRKSRSMNISICDLIKNERHIENLVLKINQIRNAEMGEVAALTALHQQLNHCQQYIARHLPLSDCTSDHQHQPV